MLKRLLATGALVCATLFAPVTFGATPHLLADGSTTNGAIHPPVETSDSATSSDGAIHPPVETAPINS